MTSIVLLTHVVSSIAAPPQDTHPVDFVALRDIQQGEVLSFDCAYSERRTHRTSRTHRP